MVYVVTHKYIRATLAEVRLKLDYLKRVPYTRCTFNSFYKGKHIHNIVYL